MNRPNAPCQYCTKRSVGCKSTCMRYKVYERMHNKYRDTIERDKEIRDLGFAFRENWEKKHIEDVRYGRTRYIRSTK